MSRLEDKYKSAVQDLIRKMATVEEELRRQKALMELFDIDNENTPTQLTADQNNFDPGFSDVMRLSSDADRTITGIARGIKGRALRMFNVGNFELTWPHESVLSDAANRIVTDTAEALIVDSNGWVEFYYDSSISRWRATGVGNSTSGDRITVELQLSADQSVADATYHQVSWGTVVKDTGGFFNAGTPTYITIPSTGWYQVTTHIAWLTNGTGFRVVLLEKNTSSPFGNIASDVRGAVTGGSTQIELSRLKFFQKNERVYVTLWHNRGAPLDIVVQGGRASYTTLIVTRM